MTEPLNLNKARKARDRAERKREADARALRFGRTKAQRLLEAAQGDKARRALDGAKLDAKDGAGEDA